MNRCRILLAAFCVASLFTLCTAESPTTQAGLSAPPADLLPNTPADFPRFVMTGQDETAQWMNRYLWYHFTNRLGNGKTLFNKETLTVADMWLGGATEKNRKKPIQEVHREDILGIWIDDEGYVHTHQHYSHAHDSGWPFPMWTQAGVSPDHVKGVAAGWHFQPNGPGWVWDHLRGWKRPEYMGETATKGWDLANCKSFGIVENKWRIEATGPSPSLTTPKGMSIDAFNAPFMQLRWKRTGEAKNHALAYMEWLREGETEFGEDRRMYFQPTPSEHVGATGTTHTMLAMYRHPKWTGKIERMRLCLAPGESQVTFDIDSFFTAYDTRHTINNPLFVFAGWNYFRWTGDLAFLHANINRMRTALRYMMTEMGGLENNFILNRWPGHDGIAGYVINADGSKTMKPGHGIGNNYYDLMPFGWKDMYSTMQYYAALQTMANLEESIRENPGWGISTGAIALDPKPLREHAAAVKRVGNELFWNEKTGRYVACIDKDGKSHDYGYPWLVQEAIWYGFATEEHARAGMDWINGKRIVAGDTSTGADIYHWRFGPRVSTLRNLDWYGQGWMGPESIPWGGQIQDGGAVLGFAFYDLMARIRVIGPDDAWLRLHEIVKWEKEVHAAGGYRAYYKDGKHGTTLQGGGTAGGIGIDVEFFESSMLPSAILYGFLGIDPNATELSITPRIPKACASLGVRNVLYRNVRLDIQARDSTLTIAVKDVPLSPLSIRLSNEWKRTDSTEPGPIYKITTTGTISFNRAVAQNEKDPG